MRHIINVILLLVSIHAFPQGAWEHPYGNPFRISLFDVVHATNDNYYICGNDPSNHRAYLAKLDGEGNFLWEKYYSILDSNYFFEQMHVVDSNRILVKASTLDFTINSYNVPRILTLDSIGNVLDSAWIDISNVYNQVGNGDLYNGANNTFWELTYIGTSGITNDFSLNRRDLNLDVLHNSHYGAFYMCYFSFNKQGAFLHDVQYDNLNSWIDEYYDAVTLYDTAGNALGHFDFMNQISADAVLSTEDGGFTLFYHRDTLRARHYDSTGSQVHKKDYNVTPGNIFGVVAAADSGYFLVTHDFNGLIDQHVVYKFNSQDDTLWSVSLNSPTTQLFYRIKPTFDGGAVLLFHNNIYGDTLNYLVRLGPNGERFSFSLNHSPQFFCYGDTVSITTLFPAAGYHWTTGDTTQIIQVTQPGSYGAVVTDQQGNTFTVNPIPIQFDSLPPFTMNSFHTCASSAHLYTPFIDGSAIWMWNNFVAYQANLTHSNSFSFTAQGQPDTVAYTLIHQLGNCRVSDTATIYFDDCTGIDEEEFADNFKMYLSKQLLHIENLYQQKFNTINIFDSSGKLKFTKNVNATQTEIDITPLPKGIYIVTIESARTTFRKKVWIY